MDKKLIQSYRVQAPALVNRAFVVRFQFIKCYHLNREKEERGTTFTTNEWKSQRGMYFISYKTELRLKAA